MPNNPLGAKLGGRLHYVEASLPGGTAPALCKKFNNDGTVKLSYLDTTQVDADGNFLEVVVDNVPAFQSIAVENEPGFLVLEGKTFFVENGANYNGPVPALVLQENADGTKNLLIMDQDGAANGELPSEVQTNVVDVGTTTITPSACFIVVQG